jgi:two-component system response regulator YesN
VFKVLIVDDSVFIRTTIKALPLWGEVSGFVIAGEAKSGTEALQLLEKHSFDLVITDICMPDMTGIELLKLVVKKNLVPCVALISQHTDFEYAKKGLLYGAMDYIVKPFVEEDLARLLIRVKGQLAERRRLEKAIGTKLSPAELVREMIMTEDLSQLIGMVKMGDLASLRLAVALGESITKKAAGDARLAKEALYASVQKVAVELDKNYSWIGKYRNLQSIVEQRFVQADETSLLLQFQASVVELVEVVNEFTNLRCQGRSAQEIAQYMLEHIDEQLSLTKIAKCLYITRTYLGEVFKEKTGLKVREYLLFLKITRAKHLLTEDQLSWDEIALLLGYNSTEYFAGLFTQHVGCSPRQYQNKEMKVRQSL